MTETKQQTIDLDYCVFRGVVLDRMTERGPRGGVRVFWRRAIARNYQVAAWSHTRDDAARPAPGYTDE